MMKRYFTKKYLIWGGAAIVAIAVVFFVFKDGNGKQTVVATRTDLIQEIVATGKIKPNQSVSLGFDKSGRIAAVFANVGDKVNKGQAIALLEAGDTSADLAKAKALLLEENIKLREIKNTAPTTYNDASKNLEATIKEGFTDADNAVRNRADQFFKNIPDNPNFEISITSGNFTHYFNVPTNLIIDINSSRKEAEVILNDWQKRTANLNKASLLSEADKDLSDLNILSAFFDKMAEAVNSFTSTDYSYNTTVSNYKTAISSARGDISGAISNLVAAKDKLNSAPTLNTSGQFEDISTQEAKVSQAEASVSSLESALAKASIVAPFDGIITLQDAKVGAIASAGGILVSMMSNNQMYIEANISEVHIGKIMIGNPTVIVLDAFPREEFIGEIGYIEPGDVLIDGIVNYKVRINFKNSDPKIKSGLTANLKIKTAQKENVLAAPVYALVKDGDKVFVDKIEGKKRIKIEVKTGLTGNNGLVEILNGLNEGDIIGF